MSGRVVKDSDFLKSGEEGEMCKVKNVSFVSQKHIFTILELVQECKCLVDSDSFIKGKEDKRNILLSLECMQTLLSRHKPIFVNFNELEYNIYGLTSRLVH